MALASSVPGHLTVLWAQNATCDTHIQTKTLKTQLEDSGIQGTCVWAQPGKETAPQHEN